MRNKIFFGVFTVFLLLCQTALAATLDIPPLKWLTCFYVSGANLEREFSLWSNDMAGLEQYKPGPHVRHIQLFGGCNDTKSNVLLNAGFPNQDILCLQPDGWHITGCNLHNPSMGDAKTMEEFLKFADNIQTEKRCLVIWGHGGGSLIGSPYDEKTDDFLDLNELGEALGKVYTPNIANPPIDLVIYNSCLMSTLENANVLKGYVKYMVASSEIVPFYGFNYDHFNTVINKNPDISARDLAELVATRYGNSGKIDNTVTSTVIDISKIDSVNTAYTAFLKELNVAAADEYTARKIRSYAYYADHYGGGNLLDKNVYDMVDLYDLAYNLREIAPNTYEQVMNSIDDVQPFYILGPNHSYGSTLSVYFPRTGLKENIQRYRQLKTAVPEAVTLAERLLGLPENIADLRNHPVSLQNNVLTARLTKAELSQLIMIEGHLILDGDDGKSYFIGGDARLNTDWETGEISYELPTDWFALDGHILPGHIADIRDDSTIFACPVIVNGKEGALCYRTDDDKKSIEIIGVTDVLGYASYNQENLYKLQPGDVVTTRMVERNPEATLHNLETFTIKGEPVIKNKPLPSGKYKIFLNFVSANQNNSESDFVDMVVK